MKDEKKEAKDKEFDLISWQNTYYNQTIFKLKNPVVVNKFKELETICNGPERKSQNYKNQPVSNIMYKSQPISIVMKSGFSKKAFITRGVCRELALFKNTDANTNTDIRYLIKEMNLLYVYNVGTFVMDLTFKTKYKDVEFFVR